MNSLFRISDPAEEDGRGPAPRPRRPAAAETPFIGAAAGRRSLKEAKPARTLSNPLPPRFHPGFDHRETQLLDIPDRNCRIIGTLLARGRPPVGSGRRSSRPLQTPREFRLLASRIPPVVDSRLDAAWGIRRSGVKAESHQWVNSDNSQ